MTEDQKNLVAHNIVKSEVRASDPLYRKWWVWVIAAVVVINLFGGQNDSKDVPTKAVVATSPTVTETTEENTWASWYILNETNWARLTDTLTSAEDCSSLGAIEMLACIDQIFSDSIRYGSLITPLPDAQAQVAFDSWLSNVEAAQEDWRSGNYDSAQVHLNQAVEDIQSLTSFIKLAQA